MKKVKDYAEGTAILKDYKKAKKEYNESKANFNQIQEDEKVFGFKSLRFFCYELGRTLGVLAFILIMFYRLLTKKDESKYIYYLYLIFIFYYIFKLCWIFKPFQDFKLIYYYALTLLISTMVVSSVWFYTKKKITLEKVVKILSMKNKRLAFFTFKNTKSERKEEMLDFLKKEFEES